MSVNAAMLKAMRDEGLSLDACIRIIEAGEKKADATNAERQARHRARKAARNAVTVTDAPPIERDHTPHSVSNETGGEPPDPVKELFDVGVSILKASGHTERQARSLIGKWRKAHSDGDVLAALVDCRVRSIANPVEWVPKRLNGSRAPPSFLEHYLEENRMTGVP